MRKVWIVTGIAFFALTMGASVVLLAIALKQTKQHPAHRIIPPEIWTPWTIAAAGFGAAVTALGATLIPLTATHTWTTLLSHNANAGGVYTCLAVLVAIGVMTMLITISEKKRELKARASGLPFSK